MTPRGDLLVIVPSRGRPQSVQAMVDAWLDTDAVNGDAELMFAVDDDDPLLLDYCEAVNHVWEASPPFKVHLRHGPRRRMIGTLNEVAVEFCSRYPMVAFLGDDHRPTSFDWTADLRTALCYGGDGPWIAYGDDGYQGEAMATAVAMSSDIVQALGYMAPPCLTHLKADQIWLEWGKAIERLVFLPRVKITHLHPWAVSGVDWDSGYEECNNAETMNADQAAYSGYMENGDYEQDVAKLRELLS